MWFAHLTPHASRLTPHTSHLLLFLLLLWRRLTRGVWAWVQSSAFSISPGLHTLTIFSNKKNNRAKFKALRVSGGAGKAHCGRAAGSGRVQ